MGEARDFLPRSINREQPLCLITAGNSLLSQEPCQASRSIISSDAPIENLFPNKARTSMYRIDDLHRKCRFLHWNKSTLLVMINRIGRSLDFQYRLIFPEEVFDPARWLASDHPLRCPKNYTKLYWQEPRLPRNETYPGTVVLAN